MTLREFHSTLLKIDLVPIKEQAVIDVKERILQMNKTQLREGKNNKGRYIEPRYSDLYLKVKRKLSSYGAPNGVPDLYLHGSFQGEMDVIVENGQYDIISWDEKNAYLTERYANIFGLTKESKELITPVVTKRFIELYREQLN